MKTLIKNGIIIDPTTAQEDREYDLLVEDNKIVATDKRGSFSNVEDIQHTIDAKKCWVVPGLIDIHVHLRQPGQEWKETIESGAKSAIKGGFTRICCMPNTTPVNDSPEITKYILEQARLANAAHVHPIGAVSIGIAGKKMAPLSDLKDAGCVAFSDDGNPVYDALLMRRSLEWCKHLRLPITCHEEILELTKGGSMNESPLSYRLGLTGMPAAAEDIMIARDIELSRLTGSQVHICHISSGRSVELVRRAKQEGIAVTAEVTMHHLILTEEAVADFNTAAKMSPPLRNEADRLALLAGVADGTIDVIASDHAPHDIDSKRVEFKNAAFGIIGFPTTLPLVLKLVHEGTLSRYRAIEALSTSPAKVFNLPAGGTLGPGTLADITVIDPAVQWILTKTDIVSKSANTPFINWNFKGKARDVLVAGQIKLLNGKLV
jgi:dihydroorotase